MQERYLPPATLLAAYRLEPTDVVPIDMGNINKTFVVRRDGKRFILQWLNPIFGAEVHYDIEAVTRHLADKGMLTPRLVRTEHGALYVREPSGDVWRLFTHIEGRVLSDGANAAICREGGRLLGRFHRAVADLEHAFSNLRPGVHDTARHLQHLREVLAAHTHHRAFTATLTVGNEILAAAGRLPSLGDLPPRVVHGDPKLNNIVFSSQDEALCLIDLDTLSRMTIPVELGDAFRSWCNPSGEDVTEANFDLALFAAGLEGYAMAARDFLTAAEVAAIPGAVETIALELSARFAADALEECYFGFDSRRFATASEHHLHRAKSQLSLARSIASQREALTRITAQCFPDALPSRAAPVLAPP